MSRNRPLVTIVGPTAVGKTRVSLRIADELNGEIISADSRLVYRGMDIGTAKPTSEERARVPHHLIDIVSPHEGFSLAEYRQAALRVINAVHLRGRLPLLVGGTGQYVMAVIEGWVPPPRPEDSSLRRELETFAEEHGHEQLHARLERIDPARADAIDARNVRRVVRALEIYETTGVPPSELRVKVPPPYDVLQIGLKLPRDELYERIDERIDRMLADGWLEEVEALLERGVPADSPALSAIGYRQLVDVLLGDRSLEDAKQEISQLTRRFVRHQGNWFSQDDPEIHWFDSRPGVAEGITEFIGRWLRGEQEADGHGPSTSSS
ncbi:MAG: tRNA (adenosine(37)-N6)-dimethylallyltransferase MiaA [Anaerolineales bacterium]|nr:tRNA (adenosine(37)-N6)-dimethylallyltransferase MiaA [Anaerolineales bacterium]